MGKVQRKKKTVTDGVVSRPVSIPESQTPVNTEQIAERAYELFLARGGSDGHDFDDWIEAERQIQAAAQRTSDFSSAASNHN
jgi:hypothetical protein